MDRWIKLSSLFGFEKFQALKVLDLTSVAQQLVFWILRSGLALVNGPHVICWQGLSALLANHNWCCPTYIQTQWLWSIFSWGHWIWSSLLMAIMLNESHVLKAVMVLNGDMQYVSPLPWLHCSQINLLHLLYTSNSQANSWKMAWFTKHTLWDLQAIIFKCQYAETGLGACNEVELWWQLCVSLCSVVKSQAAPSPW